MILLDTNVCTYIINTPRLWTVLMFQAWLEGR
jgi:hypothetical protein